ncbi:thioredoxin [Bacteroidia bacterium]|nr:thioredoxin [Bacteroidia bacterium]
MALKITDESFKELIAGDLPVVVDFWAEWCGPCRMIGPFIEELASEYEGKAVIGKVNIDENDEIAGEYGIRSIPTILYFKDGKLADKHVGAAQKSLLESKLKALL